MDFLIRHWVPGVRRYPSPFPVSAIGYVAEKKDWVRNTFLTCNFSFILSGGGEYRRGGRVWAVTAPAVLTQWPDEPLEYGPSGAHPSWEELYVIYARSAMKGFRQAGFVRDDKPLWRIRDAGRLIERCEELRRVFAEKGAEGTTDRVDRICEAMILESLLGESRPEPDPQERAVLAIRQRIRQMIPRPVQWQQLADQHGLSMATFRRRWLDVVGMPPGRYLQGLRIGEAKRLLVETRRTVAEIAGDCGYADPLYFSRSFRAETGVSPSDYRKLHRQPGGD